MYHIKRADNGEERSLHMENEVGLGHAVGEAAVRAKYSGVDHYVVNDEGEVVWTVSDVHHELPAAPVTKPWTVSKTIFYASAGFVASVLFRILTGH